MRPATTTREEPVTVAAPAAALHRFQTGWIDNPGAKLLMLSWNPGAGCRRMMDIINTSGYNVVVLQEAQKDWERTFPGGWAVSVHRNAARTPVNLWPPSRLR